MRIIVTGGNSGAGRATATALAAAGHQVVIACRNLSRGHEAAATMEGDVEVRELDLASVQTFTDTVDIVDVLVDNAGVLGLPLSRTADAPSLAHPLRRHELASSPVQPLGGPNSRTCRSCAAPLETVRGIDGMHEAGLTVSTRKVFS